MARKGVPAHTKLVPDATVSFASRASRPGSVRQKRLHSKLGGELRAARKSAGLSQAAVAEATGLSVPSVRQAERGSGLLASFEALAGAAGMGLGSTSLPPGTEITARMAAMRTRCGIGRRTLAASAGISPVTLTKMERGGACQLGTVIAVASALGAVLHVLAQGQAQPYWTGTAASSAHEGWTTPPWVLDLLYDVVAGPFDLDPCSPARGRNAPVRATVRYTEADDGLRLPWPAATVFMNPPYGRALRDWVAKGRLEAEAGRAGVVFCLIPARPDTAWWHGHIAGLADVWMLKGRLAFGSGMAPAPFPSAIVAWNAGDVHRTRMAAAFPTAWHIPALGNAGRERAA